MEPVSVRPGAPCGSLRRLEGAAAVECLLEDGRRDRPGQALLRSLRRLRSLCYLRHLWERLARGFFSPRHLWELVARRNCSLRGLWCTARIASVSCAGMAKLGRGICITCKEGTAVRRSVERADACAGARVVDHVAGRCAVLTFLKDGA